MSQTEQEKEFIKLFQDYLKEKSAEIVNKQIVPKLVEYNLPLIDWSYIFQRVRQILEDKYSKIAFRDETILKLRKALLKSTLTEARKRQIEDLKDMDERQTRCEKICRELVDIFLDEDLILNQDNYLGMATSNDDKLLLAILVGSFVEHSDHFTQLATENTEHMAITKLWKGKEREDRTWKEARNINKHE